MLKKKGTIIKWDDTKGYGFILPEDSKKHIFVHIKSFTNRNIRPMIDQNVVYTVLNNKNGKQSALNVTRATDNLFENKTNKKYINLKSISTNSNSSYAIDYKSTHKINIIYILFIIAFISFLLYFSINGKLPLYIILGFTS